MNAEKKLEGLFLLFDLKNVMTAFIGKSAVLPTQKEVFFD